MIGLPCHFSVDGLVRIAGSGESDVIKEEGMKGRGGGAGGLIS